MCNRENLPERVKKARAAIRFAKVLRYDYRGRVQSVILPGSDGKHYHVIVRRGKSISAELNVDTGSGLQKPPFARRTLTYHALAAVMIAASEQGKTVKWCANRADAQRLSNIEGKAFRLVNHDNLREAMWGVYV